MQAENEEMKWWIDSDDMVHYTEAMEKWYFLSIANMILYHNRVDLRE